MLVLREVAKGERVPLPQLLGPDRSAWVTVLRETGILLEERALHVSVVFVPLWVAGLVRATYFAGFGLAQVLDGDDSRRVFSVERVARRVLTAALSSPDIADALALIYDTSSERPGTTDQGAGAVLREGVLAWEKSQQTDPCVTPPVDDRTRRG